MMKKRGGFTLVELILTMFIFTFVVAAALSLLAAGFRVFQDNQRMLRDQAGLRLSLLQMSRDIHANQNFAPGAGSAPGSVVLRMIGTGTSITEYFVTGDQLVKSKNGASPETLASSVKQFSAVITGQYVTLNLKGTNGMEISTRVKYIRYGA